MKTSIILILFLSACNQVAAPTYELKDDVASNPPVAQLAQQEATDAGSPAPYDKPAPRASEPSLPELQQVESASANVGELQPNGCRSGQRDLGCACAPELDLGDCDCRNKELCAKDCKRDSMGVANVDMFCVDGGIAQ